MRLAVFPLIVLPVASLLAAENLVDTMTPEKRAVKGWEAFNTAKIVANVDGEAITATDVRNELRPVFPQLREQAKDEDDFARKLDELRGKVLEGLADRTLILREFKAKGMQFPASIVSGAVEEKIIREYNGDRSEYLRHLRVLGRTPMDDRKDIEAGIIVDYLTREARKGVNEISPVKIQNYYERNKGDFKQAAAVKIARIALWADASETDDEVRKRAEVILARLDKGESFADLARQFSKDDSREQGGDTGWTELASLTDVFAAPLKALPNGGHTGAIEFKTGGRTTLYILKRDDFRPEGAKPIAEVREVIENRLLGDAVKVATDSWKERLRDKFFVRYFD